MRKLVIIGILLSLISGCATHYAPETFADPYGLFSGLWHGLIFPITLLINILSWVLSLINISFLTDVQIVGRPNTGLWYYVGFAFGIASSLGGSRA